MKHASDAPAGAPFSGRNDFPRVRSAEQLPRESIHETVTVDPGIPVRCFTYEDAGILVPAHWHHSLEILLIESGGMTVTLNDARLSLHAQDFVLINSGDLHSTNCPEHSRVRVLQIPYPFLKQNIPEYDRLRFRSGPCGAPGTDAAFRHLLRSLQGCRETDGFSAPSISSSARSLHFKSLLYELLSLCVSSYLLPEAEREQSLSDTERARLITVTDILSRHGFTNYKLFRRMFRETYGCTPSAKRREAASAASGHERG